MVEDLSASVPAPRLRLQKVDKSSRQNEVPQHLVRAGHGAKPLSCLSLQLAREICYFPGHKQQRKQDVQAREQWY